MAPSAPTRLKSDDGRIPIEDAATPPAYMIVLIKITREEGWPEYRQRVSDLFAEHGGRNLVRGGPVEVLEGSYDGRRLVVFEFPSMEAIRSVLNSPEYTGIKKSREGSGELYVWAVPGV